MKSEISDFEARRPYFVLGKRLEELDLLTSREIITESKQDKELLFDPEYE